MTEIEKRFAAIQEGDPDTEDLEAIERITKANDTSIGVTLDEMDRIKESRTYSGKISLRLPRTLHRDLSTEAKQEGISLNQFILYKLSK